MPLLNPQFPLRSLTLLFTAWKALLLAIALGAALSPAYDTSTSLFFARLAAASATSSTGTATAVEGGRNITTGGGASLLAEQLTRWDALYFIHASTPVGKVYEQEYAFGTGLSSLIRAITSLLAPVIPRDVPAGYVTPLVGIFIAHITHLLSVLTLYSLTALIFPSPPPTKKSNNNSTENTFAYTTAILHILSPAGIFLSSPYAESPFSFLSFLGSYLFALGHTTHSLPKKTLGVVSSGAIFGLATWFRSNGLASGLLFAVAVVQSLDALIKRPGLEALLAVLGPIVGGGFVAVGSVVPQFLAWQRFCNSSGDGTSLRPWCEERLPSIYSFVQEHYWNVGFLRYWTPNQIPLFLLASPVLSILTISGLHYLKHKPSYSSSPTPNPLLQPFILTTAAIQTIVALLALTSYHVQIINRLASGYFVWYWWIAGCILDTGVAGKGTGTGIEARKIGWGVTVFMVMYGAIQAALYASFLPPA